MYLPLALTLQNFYKEQPALLALPHFYPFLVNTHLPPHPDTFHQNCPWLSRYSCQITCSILQPTKLLCWICPWRTSPPSCNPSSFGIVTLLCPDFPAAVLDNSQHVSVSICYMLVFLRIPSLVFVFVPFHLLSLGENMDLMAATTICITPRSAFLI